MPYRRQIYRGDEYRRRAEELRARAAESTDAKNRAALLEIAETWERMARWEDENNRPSGKSSDK